VRFWIEEADCGEKRTRKKRRRREIGGTAENVRQCEESRIAATEVSYASVRKGERKRVGNNSIRGK